MPKPYPREFRDDVVRVARNRDDGVTVEQIATLDAVSKPPLSFPAGYAQISQMFGFPGTRIDGVQMSPSPMLAASTARY